MSDTGHQTDQSGTDMGQDKPIVLITGVGGSVGSAIAASLGDAYRSVGLELDCGDVDGPCFETDLTDEEKLRASVEAFRNDYGSHIVAVIHLAAYFDFSGEHSPLYDKVNVEGTRNLLRALQGFSVERFFYSGTMLMHEPAKPGEHIDEARPLAPGWAYPQSKAKTEEVIREERGSIPVTLFHLAGLYDEKTAVPTLSHQIARIYERNFKAYVYAGERQAGQSMIHRDDMARLFRAGVDHRGDMDEVEVILAGEPEGVSYQALQDEIGRLIHGTEQWPTVSLPAPLAKIGAKAQVKAEPVVPDAIDRGQKPFIKPFMIDMANDHYALDIHKAERVLGWRPQHDIREELPALIDSLKVDPIGWYKANGIMEPDWMTTAAPKVDDLEDFRATYRNEYIDAHERFRWAHMINAALGAWLIASPPTMGYGSTAMAVSDIATGFVVLIASLFACSWKFEPARWVAALGGLWLLSAPLIFWAPTAEAYLNGTLVGALVLGLAVCTRPIPGVSPVAANTGPDIPEGWDFSPSSWTQRLPIIGLAVIGLLISRHMTAYQLGHIDFLWDPFFSGGPGPKNGSEEITTSSVSEAWPVPDAGIGALTYMLEIVTGIMGTTRRWRTMPWLVMLFGIMIVPLGVVSITFIIIQPIIIGTWCTLCLIAAAAMLLQIPYSLDELVATTQFLIRRKRQGRPLLRIFFTGDTDEGGKPFVDDFHRGPVTLLKDMFVGGVGFTWNLLACCLVGLWLMTTRLTLGSDGALANADHLIGSLVITVSVIAFAEMARALRFVNMGFGLALIIIPMVMDTTLAQTIAGFVAGGALIALSVPRGPVECHYGGVERYAV